MAVRVIELETNIEDPQMEEAFLWDALTAANEGTPGDTGPVEWFRVLPVGLPTKLTREVIEMVYPFTLTPLPNDPA